MTARKMENHFQLWEVTDAPVREILDAALGVRVIVHKQRELWRKDNVVFNLDTVEDVGQVFEVEAPARDNCDPDRQILECRRLFGPYLGRDIAGSNEDLAPPVPPRRV